MLRVYNQQQKRRRGEGSTGKQKKKTETQNTTRGKKKKDCSTIYSKKKKIETKITIYEKKKKTPPTRSEFLQAKDLYLSNTHKTHIHIHTGSKKKKRIDELRGKKDGERAERKKTINLFIKMRPDWRKLFCFFCGFVEEAVKHQSAMSFLGSSYSSSSLSSSDSSAVAPPYIPPLPPLAPRAAAALLLTLLPPPLPPFLLLLADFLLGLMAFSLNRFLICDKS